MHFSIIIPVYNRVAEVDELLNSLQQQTYKDFEVVIVDDGSTDSCKNIVEQYNQLNIKYFWKENSGRSQTRNFAIEHATGDFFIFFDSDCIIPPDYMQTVQQLLQTNPADCFGGPDMEHPSFNTIQRAVNYSMTSFLTTGGIRGGKIKLEKFKPRTFNMGFSRKVFDTVGGFKDMYGEDIDLSIRIEKAGFITKFYPTAAVYHKRRMNLKRFWKQVFIFGQARVNLHILHPGSLKLVHALPAVLTVGAILVIITALLGSTWVLLLPGAYLGMILGDAVRKTKSMKVAAWATVMAGVQITGYGIGFVKAAVEKIVLKQEMESIETINRKYK